eukprot:CAMPEP_0194479462 /NCGR_PEP_ID=MMETSP0253-20130528/2574_1 /TAXON_ID=2966 /ORGANISM="Noctiluca scintillans" /LENGTH=135 /DNA_ID=CAMNT_0039318687 /DNA_START=16 /DNA_END=423 /DNA_ORIENTATION=+
MAEGGDQFLVVSAEELAKHNKDDDCWISLHGLVLKIPHSFLDQHPGGPEIIHEQGGEDLTEQFEDIMHSDSAREWADKFVIGHLVRNGTTPDKSQRKVPRNQVAPKNQDRIPTALIASLVVLVFSSLAFALLRLR